MRVVFFQGGFCLAPLFKRQADNILMTILGSPDQCYGTLVLVSHFKQSVRVYEQTEDLSMAVLSCPRHEVEAMTLWACQSAPVIITMQLSPKFIESI